VELWKALKRRRLAMAGGAVIALLVVVGIAGPWIAPYDPLAQDLSKSLLGPSAEHWFGTDSFGRDILSRVLYGARISLIIGLGAASIGCLIGVSLGVAAGYYGGRIDQAVSYLLTCQLALPGLLLAMSLVFLIGPSVPVVIGIIGVLHWTYFLVVTRATTMQIRSLDYVSAARALGCSRWQVIAHDILPNLLNQIIVVFTLEIGVAIIAEASLSFLGVGVPATRPSLGTLIRVGNEFLYSGEWWITVFPGVALVILVLSVNLLGDWLRDALNPKLR